MCGYRFYLTALTVALLGLPIIFYKLTCCTVLLYVLYRVVEKLYERYLTAPVDTEGRAVLITGCDTGLGFLFAKCLDKEGFTVFASCLHDQGEGAQKLRQECSKRTHVIQLDVTNDETIDTAFKYVKNNLPQKGLFGIVNNAGMNFFGGVEMTPVFMYERGYEINLFGAIRVTKKFLPLIRETKGRIVNISSVHGRLCMPAQVNYESGKHALETMSDSLRLEMRKFGVTVSLVEPGMFGLATSGLSKQMQARAARESDMVWDSLIPEIKEVYEKDELNPLIRVTHVKWAEGFNCQEDVLSPVSYAITHAMCNGRPKSRYLVDGPGFRFSFMDDYNTVARCQGVLPTWMSEIVIDVLLLNRNKKK